MPAADTSEMTLLGVRCYKARNYEKAVEALSKVIDEDRDNWRARLYLAMSYFRMQQVFMANSQFSIIIASCPDARIKERALAATAAMQSTAKGMPKMTVECSTDGFATRQLRKKFD